MGKENVRKQRGRTRAGGGILANVERGPIKVKAMGNMNDLALKHTRDTDFYVKTHTSIECNIKLSVILWELLWCVLC